MNEYKHSFDRRNEPHICRHTAIDHLPIRHHGDDKMVLDLLRRTRRVSYFELSESTKLANTVRHLINSKQIRLMVDHYPWYRVEVLS